MKDYKKVNIELTKKLIEERMNKPNEGTLKRHKKIVEILNEYADKSKPLLEIGCREGDLFVLLEKQGFEDLYGVDISPLGIDILHKRGFKGEINDAQDLTINKSYDTIVISHCLEHCPEPSKVIDNVYNIINEGGIFYVEVPEQKKEPVPTKWSHYYCFSSWDEFYGFFSKDKWELLFKEVKNKNMKGVFKKCTYTDM